MMDNERLRSLILSGMVVSVVALFSYLFAVKIFQGSNQPFIIMAAIVGAVLLFKKPHVLFVVGFIIIQRGFTTLYFHVPGLLKIFDLGLVMCFISGFVIWKNYLYLNSSIFEGSLTSVAIVFLLYIMAGVVQTVLAEGQGIVQTFQMARFYLFFMIYFPLVPFLLTYGRWETLVKWLVGISVVGSLAYILFIFFPGTPLLNILHHQSGTNTVGGMKIARIHGGIVGPDYIAGAILVIYLVCRAVSGPLRKWFFMALGLIALKPVLSFGRGYTISFFMSVIIVILLAPVENFKKVRITVVAIGTLIALMGLFSLVRYGEVYTMPSLMMERLGSAGEHFTEKTGTYGIRARVIAERWDTVMQSPILGLGFIHPESGLYPQLEGIVHSGHNGYISILGEMGILGLMVLIIFSLVLIVSGYRISRLQVPFMYRAVGLATAGFMVSGYLNMISTSSFVRERSLSLIGLLMAVMQVGFLAYRKRKREKNLRR